MVLEKDDDETLDTNIDETQIEENLTDTVGIRSLPLRWTICSAGFRLCRSVYVHHHMRHRLFLLFKPNCNRSICTR